MKNRGENLEAVEGIQSVRGVVPDDRGKVLLVRRSDICSRNPGEWEFPGGQKEPGETDDDTLAREMGEEVGRKVVSIAGVVHEEARIMAGGRQEGRLYRVRFIVAQLAIGEVRLSSEHDAHTWATIKRAPDHDLTDESRAALVAFGLVLSQIDVADAN